jgi:hypothetical protein
MNQNHWKEKENKRGKNISLQMRLKEYDDSFVVKVNQMYWNLCNDQFSTF